MEFLFSFTLFTVFFILVLNGMGYDFLNHLQQWLHVLIIWD